MAEATTSTRPRAVIFDADGVLVDSYRAHFEAWRALGRFAGTFGMRNEDLMPILWGEAVPEADIPAWSRWKEATYRKILLRDFPAMDGARELIDALRAAGFRLAVGSSGPPENVAVCLKGLFLKAAAKLGVPPAACAVVEDAVAGVEAAKRAGMVAIGLTGTTTREALAARADVVVDSLRDLTPETIASLIDGQ